MVGGRVGGWIVDGGRCGGGGGWVGVGGHPHRACHARLAKRRPALDLDMPVVLHGVTECGKTAFAAAHFESPLIIRRRDDLKKISVKTDGLIFDDIDLDRLLRLGTRRNYLSA